MSNDSAEARLERARAKALAKGYTEDDGNFWKDGGYYLTTGDVCELMDAYAEDEVASAWEQVADELDAEPKSNEGSSWNDHAIAVLRGKAAALRSRAH